MTQYKKPTKSNNAAAVSQATARHQHNAVLMTICFVGAFAAFDFTIFIFFTDSLGNAFFAESSDGLSQSLKVYSIAAVGFMARPLGGFLLGRYGDKQGRRPALKLGLLLLLATSIVAACLPTYAQVGVLASVLLVAVRLIQGAAFANHIPLSWVYVTECLPGKRLATQLCWVLASISTGGMVCAIFAIIMTSIFTPEQMAAYAWRIVFGVSGAMGILGYLLVRRLAETSDWLDTHTSRTLTLGREIANTIPMFTRFHSILLTGFMSLVFASATILFSWLLPDLIARQVTIDKSMLKMVSITGLVFFPIGMVFYGWLADRLDVGRALVIGATLLSIQTIVFQYSLSYDNNLYLIPCYALLGLFSGFVALCPAVFVHLFPTRNRLTSISLIFNVVTIFTGVVLPYLLLKISVVISFAPALYFIFIALSALFISYLTHQIPNLYQYNPDRP